MTVARKVWNRRRGRNAIYTVVYLDTDRLDRMIAEARSGGRIMEAVQAAAFNVEKTAKMICPVDSSRLANSIRAESVQKWGTAVYADIGPHTDYAYWVEVGHVTSKGNYVYGHHYMTRALYQESPKLQRAIKAYIRSMGT